MESSVLTGGQADEINRLFAQPFIDHGCTVADYQVIRQDPRFKALLQGMGDYARTFVARRDSVSSFLYVDGLPQSGYTKANTDLAFDWSKRHDEETRLNLIASAVKTALNIDGVVLREHLVGMPAWQTCLVVPPHVLLRQRGIDPEKLTDEQYCNLVRPLVEALYGVNRTDYLNGCLKKDGARLEAETLKAWLTVPTTQEKGAPLEVYRMAVNPAVWFDCDGTPYSFAPMHVPATFAALPPTNKVKKVLPGDLIVAASLFIGESHLIDQIKAGTCPRSDIPGTELRGGQGWPYRPYLNGDEDEAWLDGSSADDADGDFGSLGCAGE